MNDAEQKLIAEWRAEAQRLRNFADDYEDRANELEAAVSTERDGRQTQDDLGALIADVAIQACGSFGLLSDHPLHQSIRRLCEVYEAGKRAKGASAAAPEQP